ncbi:hypothetical protein [Arthrobacter sp. 35W]|uniref:hypothetical protein n=1 Tax=Arthrobacter sp. 35W TaxID=1132441 RepID=UPI0003FECAAB|nr:hypothetical protein [Arthrobacter sp. 35W]
MISGFLTSEARRDKIASRAEAQAQALAAASGISVRTLHDPADMELASALLATIW